MEWDVIAPMIATVVLILTVGGVLVLRPIALKLSEVLALYARERHSGIENDVAAGVVPRAPRSSTPIGAPRSRPWTSTGSADRRR